MKRKTNVFEPLLFMTWHRGFDLKVVNEKKNTKQLKTCRRRTSIDFPNVGLVNSTLITACCAAH